MYIIYGSLRNPSALIAIRRIYSKGRFFLLQFAPMKHLIPLVVLGVIAMYACTTEKENDGPANEPDPVVLEELPFSALPQTTASFNLSENADHVNVMGSQRKPVPAFKSLSVKPGKAIGFVKDSYGRPIAGAHIGIRSSVVGGVYSNGTGVTNEKGYYEFSIPFGTAEFFSAAYTIDYGAGRAAIGLFPADSTLNSFASEEGVVKNFVLLPYGRGETDAISEKPWFGRNYFGGSIFISYDTKEPGDIWAPAGALLEGSEFELRLEPEEWLFHAAERKTIVIRKKTGNLNFTIVNIPVGRYKISARLVGGGDLRLKEIGPYANSNFGLSPKQAVGSTTVWFNPDGAQASSTAAYTGNWRSIDVKIQMP